MTMTSHVLYHLKHTCDISHLAYTRNTGQVTTHLDLGIKKKKKQKTTTTKNKKQKRITFKKKTKKKKKKMLATCMLLGH